MFSLKIFFIKNKDGISGTLLYAQRFYALAFVDSYNMINFRVHGPLFPLSFPRNTKKHAYIVYKVGPKNFPYFD